MTIDTLTGDTVALLQTCIRNACVNDGRPESGAEVRSSDVLEQYLGGAGLDLQRVEPAPGRRSLVARLEGTDPSAPTLCLLGHTDVVPVNADGWRYDPFGGELIDGEVWGRGALDMLNLTCSMAVAMRTLAVSGKRPKGTIIYAAVADEEAGAHYGAKHLLSHESDVVKSDYVITESGGLSLDGNAGHKLTITVGEKGIGWRRLVVKGTPGHGSMPYGSDNALVTAAEVIRRVGSYQPQPIVSDIFRAYTSALDLSPETIAKLHNPSETVDGISEIHDHGTAKFVHACSHTTFSPNVVSGGQKTNVIPDQVIIEVDIRTLPGVTPGAVDAMLTEAIGPDLASKVMIETIRDLDASASATQTPLYDALQTVARQFYPQASLVPRMTAGGTDATFFRAAGSVAYGFGLFSRAITAGDFAQRFHGNNERIDVESLRLTTQAWLALADLW